MRPDELVDRVVEGGPMPEEHRTLADLGLDSLDVVELVLALELACPGITLGDDPVVTELTPARLRGAVGAYRSLGAGAMAIDVELP